MKILSLIIYLFSLLLIAGCHSKTDVSKPQSDNISKPGSLAPAQLSVEIVGKPMLGNPVTIHLRLRTHLKPTTVTTKYTMSSGLSSGDPQTEFTITNPAANQPLQQDIHVIPNAEGTHTVNIFAVMQLANGQELTEPASVQFSIGNITQKPHASPYQQHIHTDAEGRSTIELPAEETRH